MDIQHHALDTIDSTQNWAKKHLETLDLNYCHVITAKEQTQGRGRLQRKWQSPKGEGLYVTFCLAVDSPAHTLNPLSLVTGICFAEVLQKLGLQTFLKWPNDLYVHDKKIGGVLIETTEHKGKTVLFVGVGLNLNQEPSQLKQIDRPATSIFIETQNKCTPEAILSSAETIFLQHVSLFLDKGFEAFQQDFENISFLTGKRLVFDTGKETLEGAYQSIDKEGQLQLKTADGKTHTLISGDIISWE